MHEVVRLVGVEPLRVPGIARGPGELRGLEAQELARERLRRLGTVQIQGPKKIGFLAGTAFSIRCFLKIEEFQHFFLNKNFQNLHNFFLFTVDNFSRNYHLKF